jgi:hypothetical protein
MASLVVVRDPLSLVPSSLLNSIHCCYKKRRDNLQSVGKELVHLGHLGGDAEVDCPVTDLDDEPADNVGVDLAWLADRWRMGEGSAVNIQCS